MNTKTNMTKSLRYLFIALFGLFFASCSKDRLTGNGDVISETRNTREFTSVKSSGSTRVHIEYGPEFNVEVRGSSNLVPRFKTRVINGVMELGYDHVWNVHRDDIEVYLTMPEISGVSQSGSGKTTVAGAFPEVPSFRASLSGSGQLEIRDEINCRYLSASLSGSGKFRLRNLVAEEAEVKVSGSGTVWVTALDLLKVRISGSGDVYYAGNPEIDEEISGSGDIRKL
ncbi:MAG TPA: head GIN domain-containing protein [Sphingobacteriaceae bacterium]